MGDTNYIGGIVKILEIPKQKFLKNNILVTQFRAQLPQIRGTSIVTLTVWGNLARDVANYYNVNDYILIEGYLSLRNKKPSNTNTKTNKKIAITVLKIYPFFVTPNRSSNKI